MDNEFRALRNQLKLTQEEMAEKLGVTRSYYGQIEKGRPASETLQSMVSLMRRSMELEERIRQLGLSKDTEDPIDTYHRAGRNPDLLELIADPKSYPADARSAGVLEDVAEHLKQLWLAARDDPDTAAVIRYLLQKHVPLEDVIKKE